MPQNLKSKFQSATATLILSPLFAAAAIATYISNGSPIIYTQTRLGLNKQPFEIYKFRTMKPPLPGNDSPEHDHERVTKVGKFFRRTGLDELPQLFNTLKGDMQFIGPRPRPIRNKIPTQYDEVYKHVPGLLSPVVPTQYRRTDPCDADYQDRISKALEIEIKGMQNKSLTESVKLIFKSAKAAVINNHSEVRRRDTLTNSQSPK
jgi:lipopolysaccharide/colanic/teichoic acid biosynthesis glycosyltransferase